MHESSEDLTRLQELLDRSYAAGGRHLLDIHTPARRAGAEEIVARLQGMCLLVLATVSSDCRPVGSPVDGIFYRGAFHFGSATDSLRFRHIRRRPHVTATHAPEETFAVTVHGRAVPIEVGAPEHAGFRRTLLDLYVPMYGPAWEQFMDSAVYARIDADRMLAFRAAA